MYESNTHGVSFDMNPPQTDINTNVRRFQAIKEHLFSQLNDEAVILSLKNGKYYGLNSVGVVIWTSIQTAATVVEIKAAVMSEYDVDEDTCRHEVSLFLDKMIDEELIELIDGANS